MNEYPSTTGDLKDQHDTADDRISQKSSASDINKFPVDLITGNMDSPNNGNAVGITDETKASSIGRHTAAHDHVGDDECQQMNKFLPGSEDKISLTPHEKNGRSTESNDEKKSCCAKCCSKCYIFCRPCMTKYHDLPEHPSRQEKVKYAFLCPVHGKLARFVTLVCIVLFFWAVLWSITRSQALPGGNFFGLTILIVFCRIGGALVEKLRLPSLLGMLIVGCLLRNLPVINVAKDIEPAWSSALRNIALVVILIRAGLGLDPVALRKLSWGVIRLAFTPCLIETSLAAVTSHFILGFPWIWGFMLGFVLAAVSPAVVVPSMLGLQVNGYGVDKGIPTLVIAAASVDDVLAISGFGVVLGIAFSTGDIAVTIVKGPLEAILGVVYGVVFGLLLWYIPHKKHGSKTMFRFGILFLGGLFALFGSRAADLSGAGALGCLTMPFVAALRWRKEEPERKELPVADIFASLWMIFQPLLFGLIGAEIDVGTLQLRTIGLGLAVLCIGLVIRMVVSSLAVFKTGLNTKEQIFIAFAWLPKATVQAAIGSVALDTVRQKNGSADQEELGIKLLTIAVLSILVTAPLGAVAIALLAPKLLHKSQGGTMSSEREISLVGSGQELGDDEEKTNMV